MTEGCRSATQYCDANNVEFSVFEVTLAHKHHRYSRPVCRLHALLVADGAARLDDGGDAGLFGGLNAVGEGKNASDAITEPAASLPACSIACCAAQMRLV